MSQPPVKWKEEDEVQQAEIEGWDEGKEIEGTFLELRDGSVGKLFDVQDWQGKLHTVGAPTILARLLKPVQAGDFIRVLCTGQVQNAKGQDTWTFRFWRKAKAS